MKIIDENGAAIETPDLTLGYLVDDTEPVEHPAVEGVEEVSHYETVAECKAPHSAKPASKLAHISRICRTESGFKKKRTIKNRPLFWK